MRTVRAARIRRGAGRCCRPENRESIQDVRIRTGENDSASVNALARVQILIQRYDHCQETARRPAAPNQIRISNSRIPSRRSPIFVMSALVLAMTISSRRAFAPEVLSDDPSFA